MNRRSLLKAAVLVGAAMSVERAQAGTLLKSKANEAPTRFMNFTILSSGATLLAWSSVAYREDLLINPNNALQRFWSTWPASAKAHVHENTESVTHLPLPFRGAAAADLPHSELLDVISHETGDDKSLDYFLPTPVLAQAFVDAAIRHQLLMAPRTVLRASGHDPGQRTIIVLENSAVDYHLALPRSPSSIDRLESMERHILLNAQAGTTKCSASGTCDIRPGGGGPGGCLSCHGDGRMDQGTETLPKQPGTSPFPSYPSGHPLKIDHWLLMK